MLYIRFGFLLGMSIYLASNNVFLFFIKKDIIYFSAEREINTHQNKKKNIFDRRLKYYFCLGWSRLSAIT